MSIVAFISRDTTGTNTHGTATEGNPSVIDAARAKDISLNLSPAEVESYARQGQNLHVVLNDGTTLVVRDFYNETATGAKNLFLSDNGSFIEVVLEDKAEGMLFASYEPLDLAGKWSAYDDMVFLGVDRIEPVVAPLAAPAFGGLGLLGAAGAGTAALVGGLGGGGGDDGTGPTVNDADGTYVVAEGDPDGVTVSGTGEPGSEVSVVIGSATGTTTVGDDGTWSVDFPTGDLPGDGDYETVVTVVDPEGTTYELDGPTIDIDMTPPEVEITAGTQSVGDVVNAEEQSTGTVISGTGEAGATVALTIGGETQTTTVGADGSWSVTFTSAQIGTGEYSSEITIVTTDPYGNSTTTTDTLVVDTETSASFDATQAGDNIVSGAEMAAGVTITGTAEAGATVSVTVMQEGSSTGVTRTAVADADGNWSVTYEAGSLPEGEYNSTLTLTSTDLAGNVATDTHSLYVDTFAGTVEISAIDVTNDNDTERTDGVINEVERDGGVTVTGTAAAGEEVTVSLGTASGTATADASGNWSYTFDAADIPEGTGTLDVTATISDDLGNTASDSETVGLDTQVTNFASSGVSGGNTVNRAELEQGFELTGTVEAGSSVMVEINGVSRAATVAADGSWTVSFDADVLTGSDAERDAYGEYSVTPTITATDAAGNTAVLSPDTPLNITIDTEVDTPAITGTGTDGDDNLTSISVDETSGENFTVNTLEADGTAPEATAAAFDVGSNTMLAFDDAVADGTNLVVTSEDAAGNQSSVMVMFEDNATETSVLNHSGAAEFNVDTLNLEFADQVNLTLTEADINALSGNSDTLTIRGNSDDTVTVTGAISDGTREVDGETFDVYTIGDDGTTLLVEEDVQVVI